MAEESKSSKLPDPWGAYCFSLEIDHEEVAQFLECSGLKSAAEVFEIEEGGTLRTVHKRPGRSKWENIILKRAVHKSHLFEAWREEYMQIPESGWSKRKDTTVAIVVRANDNYTKLRTFTIRQAWPISWEGPSLSSGGSALSEETLEIAHEGIILGEAPPPTPAPTPAPLPEKLETKPVNFKYDQPKDPDKDPGFTPEGEDAMEDTADQLKEHEDVKEIWVEGHTCDLGAYDYNLSLSKRRAKACRNNLEKNASGKTYHDDGYSYKYPKVPNTDEAHRAQNRRVEFWQTPRGGKRSGELDYKSYK